MPLLTSDLTPPRAGTILFLPDFDDVPFLATDVERHCFHVEVLSHEWPLYALIDLAVQQSRINQLPTPVVLDKVSTVSFMPDGEVLVARVSRHRMQMVTGCLALVELLPATEEYLERMTALVRALAETPLDRSASAFQGGRPATPAEVEGLSGTQWNGAPRGLEECPECGEWSGECLLPGAEPALVPVCCRCQPLNLCALCREPFDERPLCANHYDAERGELVYVPGWAALEHRCSS